MAGLFQSTKRGISWALRVGCGVHLIHSNFYEISETHGESMLPTLDYSGSFVHINKMCQLGHDCHVGDMIVALKPTDPSQRVCKRITGMPGDIIQVDPSEVFSSGSSQNDSFEADQDELVKKEPKYIKVPEGHCWVTGDNLSRSLDSRSYGVLPLGLIKGKIIGHFSSQTGERHWAENTLKPSS